MLDEYNFVAEVDVSTISVFNNELLLAARALEACVQHALINVGVKPLSTKLPLASGISRALAGAVVFFWKVASILLDEYNFVADVDVSTISVFNKELVAALAA